MFYPCNSFLWLLSYFYDVNTQSSQSMDTSSIKQYTSQSCASQLQSQSAPTTAGGCNGAVKPRVRARRGQATDPHSIAERVSTLLLLLLSTSGIRIHALYSHNHVPNQLNYSCGTSTLLFIII